MNTKSNAGFSLVELMVVVAIIGVLATVAVPNYMKFQSKAKQTSAKTELAGVYTAEKAFFVEYTSYHNSLPLVGYVPEGYTGGSCPAGYVGNKRIYTVGFQGALAPLAGAFPADPCGAAIINNYGAGGAGVFAKNTTAAPAPLAAATATAVSFQAQAAGAPGGTVLDLWTMNDANVLNNASSGI